jgi:hypothetical protein
LTIGQIKTIKTQSYTEDDVCGFGLPKDRYSPGQGRRRQLEGGVAFGLSRVRAVQ